MPTQGDEGLLCSAEHRRGGRGGWTYSQRGDELAAAQGLRGNRRICDATVLGVDSRGGAIVAVIAVRQVFAACGALLGNVQSVKTRGTLRAMMPRTASPTVSSHNGSSA